jgi:hypothetical protein
MNATGTKQAKQAKVEWIGQDQETARRVRKLQRWQPDWVATLGWIATALVVAAVWRCVYLYVWLGWLGR